MDWQPRSPQGRHFGALHPRFWRARIATAWMLAMWQLYLFACKLIPPRYRPLFTGPKPLGPTRADPDDNGSLHTMRKCYASITYAIVLNLLSVCLSVCHRNNSLTLQHVIGGETVGYTVAQNVTVDVSQ